MADETDIKLLRHIQDGIPLTERPYQNIADALGLSEDEVMDRIKRLLDEKKIRRFAASVAHRKIGINSNAMTVWRV
ncbi:MAG: Lrp/AsnC family transcriptional regulator, partial [Candidatus Brocadiales bacterium]